MNNLESRKPLAVKPKSIGFFAELKREQVLAGALILAALVSTYFVGEHNWFFNKFGIYATFGHAFTSVLALVIRILAQAILSVIAVALIRSKKGKCTFVDTLSASILPALWVWPLYMWGCLKGMDPYSLESYPWVFDSAGKSALFCLGTAAAMLILTVASGKFYKRNNSITVSNKTKMLAIGLVFVSALTAVGLPLCINYTVSAPLGSAIVTTIAQVIIPPWQYF